MRSYLAFRVQDDDLSPATCDRSRDRQSDDAGADNHAVKFVGHAVKTFLSRP
jgi:hypothetical protein